MAPAKFGLFKTRSRDHPDQPSTENLLANNNEVMTPGSPTPATSQGCLADMSALDLSMLSLNYESEVASEKHTPKRRSSQGSVNDNGLPNYRILNNASADATSISTLHDDDYDRIDIFQDLDSTTLAIEMDQDGASTSCDANSIQFDESSIAPSEDMSVYCGNLKKPKKMRSREEQQLRDFDMWQASNVEVMENLLNRSGNLDEQIKWEAIATARGLCTLTDNCTCTDCNRTKYLSGVSDGDGGLGAAPLFNAISVGCTIQ